MFIGLYLLFLYYWCTKQLSSAQACYVMIWNNKQNNNNIVSLAYQYSGRASRRER